MSDTTQSNGATGPAVETFDSVYGIQPPPDATQEPNAQSDVETGEGQDDGNDKQGSDTSAGQEQGEVSDVEKAKAKTAKGVQKRLDELTAQREDARRVAALEAERADALATRLEALEGGNTQQKPAARQDGAPNPDDYPMGRFDQGYQDAYTDWKISKALADRDGAEAQRQSQTKLERLEAEARAVHTDYDDIVAGFIRSPTAKIPAVLGILQTMENPTEIAYQLGSDPELLESLGKLPPYRIAAKMAQIEDELAGTQAKPERLVSKAPPPPPKIAGGISITNPMEIESSHVDEAMLSKRVAAVRKQYVDQGLRPPY